MAKPIKPTPPVLGADARRFERAREDAQDRDIAPERIHAIRAAMHAIHFAEPTAGLPAERASGAPKK